MKIFVSTRETQGKRKNDFSFTEGNEPVSFGIECSNERVDGHCGCRRSLAGIYTMRSTTTFTVAESGFTKKQYTYMLQEILKKAGFLKEGEEGDWKDILLEETDFLLQAADKFPVGVVLERRGSVIRMRSRGFKRLGDLLISLLIERFTGFYNSLLSIK